MPAGTKIAKTETALKAEAKKKGLKGEHAQHYIYGTLNNIGMMHGNKATKKGLKSITPNAPFAKRTVLSK